jgi:hypothetical protein
MLITHKVVMWLYNYIEISSVLLFLIGSSLVKSYEYLKLKYFQMANKWKKHKDKFGS